MKNFLIVIVASAVLIFLGIAISNYYKKEGEEKPAPPSPVEQQYMDQVRDAYNLEPGQPIDQINMGGELNDAMEQEMQRRREMEAAGGEDW